MPEVLARAEALMAQASPRPLIIRRSYVGRSGAYNLGLYTTDGYKTTEPIAWYIGPDEQRQANAERDAIAVNTWLPMLRALEKDKEADRHFSSCEECTLWHGLESPCEHHDKLTTEARRLSRDALALVAEELERDPA